MWTKRFAVVLLVAVVVVAIAGMRDTPVRRALAQDGPTEVERALDRPLPNFRLDAVPLEESIALLKQAGGVEILLDREKLEAAGIDLRTPVTVPPLPKHTLARVLAMALESLPGSPARLRFTPREDHLFVSTGDELAKDVRVRVYDLRDLLAAHTELPYHRNVPDAVAALRATGPPPTLIDEIMNLITETVAPDSWRDAGGTVGVIGDFGGRLFVCQTWENHRSVGELLEELRQASPPIPQPAVKHVWHDPLQRWVRDTDAGDPELALWKTLPADQRLDAYVLPAALETLAKASGVEILLDEEALAAVGYDANRPIGMRRAVGGWTLARALDRALAAAGDPPLGYTVDERRLLVTTRQRAESHAITRLYDVRDLLDFLLHTPPALPPARGAQVGAREVASENLSQAIRDTVDPESWRDNGGNVGAIRDLAGFLLITQNLKNHAGVARTLADLRAGRSTTRPAPAPAGAVE